MRLAIVFLLFVQILPQTVQCVLRNPDLARDVLERAPDFSDPGVRNPELYPQDLELAPEDLGPVAPIRMLLRTSPISAQVTLTAARNVRRSSRVILSSARSIGR
jgi:hypothetical protein